MQQSNFIFGILLVAFIVFITIRGELQTYLNLLRGSGNASGSLTASSNSVTAGANQLLSQANSSVGGIDSLFNSASPANDATDFLTQLTE